MHIYIYIYIHTYIMPVYILCNIYIYITVPTVATLLIVYWVWLQSLHGGHVEPIHKTTILFELVHLDLNPYNQCFYLISIWFSNIGCMDLKINICLCIHSFWNLELFSSNLFTPSNHCNQWPLRGVHGQCCQAEGWGPPRWGDLRTQDGGWEDRGMLGWYLWRWRRRRCICLWPRSWGTRGRISELVNAQILKLECLFPGILHAQSSLNPTNMSS